ARCAPGKLPAVLLLDALASVVQREVAGDVRERAALGVAAQALERVVRRHRLCENRAVGTEDRPAGLTEVTNDGASVAGMPVEVTGPNDLQHVELHEDREEERHQQYAEAAQLPVHPILVSSAVAGAAVRPLSEMRSSSASR